jgi:hypothetical protein
VSNRNEVQTMIRASVFSAGVVALLRWRSLSRTRDGHHRVPQPHLVADRRLRYALQPLLIYPFLPVLLSSTACSAVYRKYIEMESADSLAASQPKRADMVTRAYKSNSLQVTKT